MDTKPVTSAPAMIEQYLDLFQRCFPNATQYSKQYLQWLYSDNPAGPVVGFNAFDGARLVAHYVCVPAPIVMDGAVCKGLLSLNTATDPGYQGKGLFVRLANLTYEKAAQDGFNLVFGVANANSTPGFTRKLGFQKVCSLLAMVGIGPLTADPHVGLEHGATFRRQWTPELLQWRLSNIANPVFARGTADRASFSSRTSIPGLVSWAERSMTLPDSTRQQHPAHIARVFVGCLPKTVHSPRFYAAIPDRLRPSPLNLIYRPVSAVPNTIDASGVFFDFLDFDAF